MTRMRDKNGNEQDVPESAVKDLSHIGWIIVPTEGEPAAGQPATPPGLKRVVEEANVLEPGKHTGKIVGVEPRSGVSQRTGKSYTYVDVQIECDGKTVKAGYPDTLSPVSMLGKLLERFGAKVMPGDNIDIEGGLLDRAVEFQTTTDASGYSNVERDTLCPKEGVK